MVESPSSTCTPWRDVVDAGMFADEQDDQFMPRRRSVDDSGRRRSADGAPSSEMVAPPPPPLNGRAYVRDVASRDWGVTFSTPSNLWGAVAAGDREGTGGEGSSSAFVATIRQAEPTETPTETTNTTTATSDSELIGAGEGAAASALGSKWWASDSEASEGEEEEDGEVRDEDEDDKLEAEQQQQLKQKQAGHNLRRDLVLGRLLGLVCAPAGGALPHALPSLAAQLQRLGIIPLWLKVRTEVNTMEMCIAWRRHGPLVDPNPTQCHLSQL
jgi:hypothetical protein